MVQLQQKKDARTKEEHSTPTTIHHRLGQTRTNGAELIYSFRLPAEHFREMKLRNGGVVVTDQVDKNFIADLLVLLVILVVVVGDFALLHTPAILLGGGLALVVAVAAEFAWSR